MKPLAEFLARARKLVVLTGAGCSTESGIPDFRSPGGVWNGHQPVDYNDFLRSENIRRAYWARSYANWPRFDTARPNAEHRAGSRKFVQLHRRNRVAVRLDCHSEFARADIFRDADAHVLSRIAGKDPPRRPRQGILPPAARVVRIRKIEEKCGEALSALC